jgi:transposase
MLQPLSFPIKESLTELRKLQKQFPRKYKAIQMLIVIKQKGALSKDVLAVMVGASDRSIQTWRSNYVTGGVDQMLQDSRGGKKASKITGAVHQQLSKRLTNSRQGFRSFIEIQQWLLNEFSIDMKYHAVNKYVKRKFGARLKVSRKSHVLKSPADEAVFKKPVRKIGVA